MFHNNNIIILSRMLNLRSGICFLQSLIRYFKAWDKKHVVVFMKKDLMLIWSMEPFLDQGIIIIF